MRTLLFILLAISSRDCNRETNDSMKCNKEQAEMLTAKKMKKAGFDINQMRATVKEDNSYFFIEYLPKDTMSLGGGGNFKVSKKDCEIVNGELYQ